MSGQVEVPNSSQDEANPDLTRTEKRSARTERSLLNAAKDVFLERGLAAATIEEITHRADVGKGTFYIYYSSKTAIFESLVALAMKRLLAKIRALQKDALDLRTAIDRLIEADLQYAQEDPKGFRLIAFARSLLQLKEVELPDCVDVFETHFHLLEQAIRRHAKTPPDPIHLRRIAILLANASSGYLSFEAFDMSAERMMLAYRPVREAMANAIAALVQTPHDGKSAPAEGKVPPAAAAKSSREP